jgi:uncharacterized Tic20 family protein
MSDHQPDAARPADSNAPPPAGPAGWPGATHFGSGANEPATPPPPPVEEVVAVPLSKAEARGPAIEVEGERVGHAAPGATTAGAPPPPPRAAEAPPPPPPPAGGAAAAAVPFTGSRIWAVLAHLAYLIPFNVPGLIVTILIWVCTRRGNPFADDQAREALNFQLCYAVVNFVLGATCFLAWLCIPFWLVGAVLSIVAATQAGDGLKHRYPYIFRLIQ